MPRQPKKAIPRDDKDDLVITPAGPVPKERVSRVGPNQIVRRNKDGTYTIVDKPAWRHKRS